ncbi:hypothetical protein XG70_10640 [Salmonella enterica subsp. enterica serovar Bredeney]|nr:hypothetical protein [Salmonella enterica subsp. enterica serovar Bredeney]EBV6983110.1 hypothetical protein [Salmonella enterica subsp. enterica serovar Bredeney]EBX4095534.1 hypothetical protein [Salmonella enterica subsp. enterica serovar Bredeney]EBZ8663992.1 hypothetical protein [Salmonella enterica subsp. enterica serovar Bredeney]MLT03121.1 hypothetical protein [Salmonella enterica subsp. enterica serovar Bredeney]
MCFNAITNPLWFSDHQITDKLQTVKFRSDDQIKMPQKRQKNIAIFNNRLMNNPIPHPLIMRHFLSQKPSILKNL